MTSWLNWAQHQGVSEASKIVAPNVAHISINSIVNQVIEYRMLGLHLERLADITSSKIEEGLEDEGRFVTPVSGSLALNAASFSADR